MPKLKSHKAAGKRMKLLKSGKIVRGKAGEVRGLADSLTALRGVRNASLSMGSTGKNLH